MYTSLQVAHTEGLNTDQRELVNDLDAEVCTREMLGVLITMMHEIDGPLAKNKDFVTRGQQVFTFLREHGIDLFDGADFMRWNNMAWIGALKHLRSQEYEIDNGMISSQHPHIAYVGKPFVKGEIAESAGESPDILPFLQDDLPEFNFQNHTLDTRTRIAKVGDYLHLTEHPLLTSDHPHYTHFVRDRLVPRAEEIVSASVAAEGNHMLKKWLKICAAKGNPGVSGHKDVFFRQLAGMREDRNNLFATVRFADQHVLGERVMHPNARARDVKAVVDQISSALRTAWQHKHRAGQELVASHSGKIRF